MTSLICVKIDFQTLVQADKLVFNFDREFHAQFKSKTENKQQFNINFEKFLKTTKILVKTARNCFEDKREWFLS